jgi:hypothetical protein
MCHPVRFVGGIPGVDGEVFCRVARPALIVTSPISNDRDPLLMEMLKRLPAH